ncbi:MAG TPA: S9 family peptidase [Ornithinimicrobium sp.]|uniref:S9 family peptidase n=1 Tax=Ornithinimicrobium sp. TaxID=1977084 RepID=UPI002B49F987|nr:S9 family peptidase [Ornithinimicrobium sp.]HKJ11936.1 S9 family peptidase [Ornithinimicrobium sp.]
MTSPSTRPPQARRVESWRTHHGEAVPDPYEWMRDKSDPELLAHLEAENAHTEAMTAHLDGLRADIFAEISAHTQQSDQSVAVRRGAWWYYTRTVEGQQYPIFARIALAHTPQRPAPSSEYALAGEEILLDANVEAAGADFFSLGALEVSPAGSLLAYAVDQSGDERFDVRVLDISTGQRVEEAVRDTGYGLVWSWEGDYLFYTRVDDAWRPYQVWRHRVGGPAEEDVLVLEEPDERFWVGLGGSRDDRLVTVSLASKNTSEWWILPADAPTAAFRCVAAREEGVEYDLEPAAEGLWVVHNRTHPDFELAWAPPEATSAMDWHTVRSGAAGERVTGVDAFADHLAISVRRDGLAEVDILELSQGQPRAGAAAWPVSWDEPIRTIEVGANPEFDCDTLLVHVESMLTPPSVYEVDLSSGERTLLKQRPVPGGYDPAQYRQERLWATADDGTRIPISVVALADVASEGNAPGLLYGYGAYEICVDPGFSAARLSYLDRGVVYAVAHVRGGGELGRTWYEQGRMEHKENTFTDFVACADHLLASGWVAPGRLAAEGGSAGGLLMGAAVNIAPDRFRAVHAAVPFVDALNTILDPSLPLTVVEWEEWGDPLHDEQVYERMRRYTPYENVGSGEYPAILATTGLNDTRVYYVEPAKWVARLRERVSNDPRQRPLLLKTEMVAGHGGKTGRYDVWRDTAFEMAFLLDQIGAVALREQA